jgi:cytochrome c biogenesis protein CcmG, thiol:disulfide interchange protein DsbE
MSSSFSEHIPDGPHAQRSAGPSGLAILAFVGFGMLAGILFLSWLGSPRIDPAVGQPMGKLDLTPIAFAEAPFSEADLNGKVTVLHFWGTWCPPCRAEFPEFAKLAEHFASNDGVQIISVSSSQGPEYDIEQLTESTKSFLAQYEAQVPTYADPVGLSRAQAGMLLPDGSLPYPCTFVLDRRGVVAGVWIGFSPKGMHEVSKKVTSLL